ncbi:MAG: hypothetical protein ACYDCL_04370 [Myxococcales bacterium]
MRALATFLLGALLGTAASVWLGPQLIHWYAQPPFAMGCDCGPAMGWAMEKLRISEAVGAGAGAAVALVLYFVIRSRKKPPAKPALESPKAAG